MNSRPTEATPARLYCLLAGILLTLAGIGGFLYESSLGTGEQLASDDVAGVWATNGWLNLLYLLAGLTGLAAARREPRRYALIAGAAFTVLAVAGMIVLDGDYGTLLDLLPLSPEGNVLHLLAGVGGLLARAGTPARGSDRG